MGKVLKISSILLFIFTIYSCTFNVNRYYDEKPDDEKPQQDEDEDVDDDSQPSEPWTKMISVGVPDTAPNGTSDGSFISADGRYIVFVSAATNLVNDDSNGKQDVFIYDTQEKTTDIVSTSSTGDIADGDSSMPSMSADNHYVAFVSTATNLVANDTNKAVSDIFVKDLVTGTTTLVSLAPDGSAADADSSEPQISADGKFVVYSSMAMNLTADDTNGIGIRDIFRVELSSLTTVKVNFGDLEQETGSNSTEPFISGNGNYVLFTTLHALDAIDLNGRSDIYMRDINAGTTVLVSVTPDGSAAGNNFSQRPSISEDGTMVAFSSAASDIVAGLVNPTALEHIFVRNMTKNTTSLASWNYDNTAPPNQSSQYPRISGDGQSVIFQSSATDIIAKGLDNNARSDIFVRDLDSSSSSRVNVASDGTESNGNIRGRASISHDGSITGFSSSATNMISSDTNGFQDVFFHNAVSKVTDRAGLAPSKPVAGNNKSQESDISDDGSRIAFTSSATNLVPGDTNGFTDVFLYDRGLDKIERISLSTKGGDANGSSDSVRISGDGDHVVYVSIASNLVATDINGLPDIFLYSKLTGLTTRISISIPGVDGQPANANSYSPSVSDDGTYVAFASDASNLVAIDKNKGRDIFVRNTITGITKRISMGFDGTEANGNSDFTSISGDGRYVVYCSYATNIVADDTNGTVQDIFVYDMLSETTIRVNLANDSSEADAHSYRPDISSDGNVVSFYSDASNLVDGDTNGKPDVFVRDIASAKTILASIGNSGNSGNGSSVSPRLSASGRYVVFDSEAEDLVSGDTNASTDVFIRDLQENTTEIISLTNNGEPSNAHSIKSSVSNDGNYILFLSNASNLVDSPANASNNLFLRYRDIK